MKRFKEYLFENTSFSKFFMMWVVEGNKNFKIDKNVLKELESYNISNPILLYKGIERLENNIKELENITNTKTVKYTNPTSWTKDKKIAINFMKGFYGNSKGIIISRKFKPSEVIADIDSVVEHSDMSKSIKNIYKKDYNESEVIIKPNKYNISIYERNFK